MKNIVKKSHELVLAKYSFSLLELRLFSLLLSKIDDRNPDFAPYRIAVKDLIQTFNLKSKNIYAEIKELTSSMLKKIVVIPIIEQGIPKEIKGSVFTSFKYQVNGR